MDFNANTIPQDWYEKIKCDTSFLSDFFDNFPVDQKNGHGKNILGTQLCELGDSVDALTNVFANQYNQINALLQSGDWYTEDDAVKITEAMAVLDVIMQLVLPSALCGWFGMIARGLLNLKMQIDQINGMLGQGDKNPITKPLKLHRDILCSYRSRHRTDFSSGIIEWQFPKLMPALAWGHASSVDDFIQKSKEKSEILQNASSEEVLQRTEDLLLEILKRAACDGYSVLEVYLDDILDQLKRRSDYHPEQLLMVFSYFSNFAVSALKNVSHAMFSLFENDCLEKSIKDGRTYPYTFGYLEDTVRISDVEKYAKEVAASLLSQRIPFDDKINKLWNISLIVPLRMPLDTHEIESANYYLSSDGYITAKFGMIDSFDSGRADLIALTERFQYDDIEWESADNEWAYPSPKSFFSAREALLKIKATITALTESAPQKIQAAAEKTARQKAAEDAKRADETRRAEEARRAQVAQWQSQGLCQYCGGKKGLFNGKCKSCGK